MQSSECWAARSGSFRARRAAGPPAAAASAPAAPPGHRGGGNGEATARRWPSFAGSDRAAGPPRRREWRCYSYAVPIVANRVPPLAQRAEPIRRALRRQRSAP